MIWQSYGKITVANAGTPQKVAPPTGGVQVAPVHGLVITALSGNTGKVYIGVAGMNKATLAGVLRVLGVPPVTGDLPNWQVVMNGAPNGLDIGSLVIDVDTNGEGAVIGVFRG